MNKEQKGPGPSRSSLDNSNKRILTTASLGRRKQGDCCSNQT